MVLEVVGTAGNLKTGDNSNGAFQYRYHTTSHHENWERDGFAIAQTLGRSPIIYMTPEGQRQADIQLDQPDAGIIYRNIQPNNDNIEVQLIKFMVTGWNLLGKISASATLGVRVLSGTTGAPPQRRKEYWRPKKHGKEGTPKTPVAICSFHDILITMNTTASTLEALHKQEEVILSLDLGTTSVRVIAFNHKSEVVASVQEEFGQSFPHAGWVEQDPLEIWQLTQELLGQMLEKLASCGHAPSATPDASCGALLGVASGTSSGAVSGATPEVTRGFALKPKALGIANQRETTVVWDKTTGEPVYPAIVWQSRQTSALCDALIADGYEDIFTSKTGLPIDAYFSATKIRWILDAVPGAQGRAEQGELLFGTIDTWILWNLTNRRVHATDYTNASRTLVYDIFQKEWSRELLDILQIPPAMLPEVFPSSHNFGVASIGMPAGAVLGSPTTTCEIPIAGIAGDQQAALFGQCCFEEGIVKNTYGTGCFALMNTGSRPILSKNGLLTTMACALDGKVEYALEGSIFVAGSAVQWLRDSLKFIDHAAESEDIANSIASSEGVYMVPAFVGMGSPYWNQDARGALFGLTRGSGQAEIVRATLESIAYQTRDLLTLMSQESGYELPCLRVDGGAAENKFLMQFQADILGVRVDLPKTTETTALGAAYLAGLAVGFWDSREELAQHWQVRQHYYPVMAQERREKLYRGWKRAVKATLSFVG